MHICEQIVKKEEDILDVVANDNTNQVQGRYEGQPTGGPSLWRPAQGPPRFRAPAQGAPAQGAHD